MDGARTLVEAAARMRQEAEWLEELARAGFELNAPVEDDYGFVGHPDVEPAPDDED
jgi:hypothetical protein